MKDIDKMVQQLLSAEVFKVVKGWKHSTFSKLSDIVPKKRSLARKTKMWYGLINVQLC